MKINKKICKGINSAKGHEGCGDKVYRFRYGLCKKCFNKWLLTTKEGKAKMDKSIIKAAKIVRQKAKAKTREQKKALMTKSDWEKKLQIEINKIIREIDKGHKCISSQTNLNKKYDAGHYYSVGSTPHLRFNLHNIFAQSVRDNRDRGGNPIDYIKNIETLFGKDYRYKIDTLRARYKSIKLSIKEIEEAIKASKEFYKYVVDHRAGRGSISLQERIDLRYEGNILIGIYEEY